MRTFIVILAVCGGLFLGRLTPDCQAQAQATLAWNASANPNVAGYYVAWGTNSGVYFATNTFPGTATSGSIPNLGYNIKYYFAVAAFSTNGEASLFSNEATFSNAPPVAVSAPPPPPGSDRAVSGRGAPIGVGAVPGGGSGSGNSGASASSGAGASSAPSAHSGSGGGAGGGGGGPATNIVQAQIWGIPPVLNLTVANGQPILNIGGTVGATVAVQSTANIASPYGWTTITNVLLTNAAAIDSGSTPGQPQDAIDLAYVPAAQMAPLPTTTSSAGAQYFRVFMPYDYIILAGMVLPAKGYSARLVVVNMPGLNDDGCYVSQASSFIHFNPTNSALQLEPSGSTIRQIASTLANNLNLDWTTASEFVYSNGMGQILATVVEADPASSDPVAGTTPTSSIVINF